MLFLLYAGIIVNGKMVEKYNKDYMSSFFDAHPTINKYLTPYLQGGLSVILWWSVILTVGSIPFIRLKHFGRQYFITLSIYRLIHMITSMYVPMFVNVVIFNKSSQLAKTPLFWTTTLTFSFLYILAISVLSHPKVKEQFS